MCGELHRLAALPPGKARYPLYKRLGGPQDRYGRVQKISPPPGFGEQIIPLFLNNFLKFSLPKYVSLTQETKKKKKLLLFQSLLMQL